MRSKLLEHLRQGKTLDYLPVIDSHCHLGRSSDFYHIPKSGTDEVVAVMARYGVAHALTFSIGVASDPRAGNNIQYAAAREFPDRFTPLTFIHARFPQDWTAELEFGAANGCRGVKLITGYQGIDENKVDWAPALDFAKDRGWVVLNHHWGATERLDMWAERYPSIAFIVGHGFGEYGKVAAKRPNVYISTCACFVPTFCSSFEELCRLTPAEKLLYGSDALDLDFGTGLGPIAYADIPERDKEMILGGNALKLFKQLGWDLSKWKL